MAVPAGPDGKEGDGVSAEEHQTQEDARVGEEVQHAGRDRSDFEEDVEGEEVAEPLRL